MPKIIQIITNKSLLEAQASLLTENPHMVQQLSLPTIFNEEELAQLEALILQSNFSSLNKMIFHVDCATLKNPRLQSILKHLNTYTDFKLELVFTKPEMQNAAEELKKVLLSEIAPIVAYPLSMKVLTEDETNATSFIHKPFQDAVIANIQKKNKAPLMQNVEAPRQEHFVVTSFDPGEINQLKKLIKDKKTTELKKYFSVEVHHTLEQNVEENVEQNVVQNYENVIEQQINLDLQDVKVYQGELVNYEMFITPHYRNKSIACCLNEEEVESLHALLKQELFANLPKAIKYLSPAAAEQLSEQLPTFVSLNKENLPHGFHLKQTATGEFVLDYDLYLENEQANVFTPKALTKNWEPFYEIELREEDVRRWIADDDLFNRVCSSPYTTPAPLINLWISYDDEGVIEFFNKLKSLTQPDPTIVFFLLDHYLKFLPQWDHLQSNDTFFKSIQRLSRFDKEKQVCLMKFLEKTGSSRYDITQAIEAFELFWAELNVLCTEQGASIASINKGLWTTPVGGNPVVYMERMLVILRNARNVGDQLNLLKKSPVFGDESNRHILTDKDAQPKKLRFNDFVLNNYGPYYASRYEGFKAVSPEMALHYNEEAQTKQAFNKDLNYYRLDLPTLSDYFLSREYLKCSRSETFWLVDCSKELPKPATLENWQQAGIVLPFDLKNDQAFVEPYQLYTVSHEETMDLLFSEKPKALCNNTVCSGSFQVLLENEEMPDKRRLQEEIFAASFRYMGTQSHGIKVSELIKAVGEGWYGVDSYIELITLLFFTTHTHYENDDIEFVPVLLQRLHRFRVDPYIYNCFHLMLMELYKRDIKFSPEEGEQLLHSVGVMRSYEFESFKLSVTENTQQLLTEFKQNRFGMIKLLQTRKSARVPMLYDIETAQYFAKDPLIALTYPDDLLSFSYLIGDDKNPYSHARFNKPEESFTDEDTQLIIDLYGVKSYLHQASTKEKSNIRYAIQVIINAKKSFNRSQFLNAFYAIKALNEFNCEDVDKILQSHGFEISANLAPTFRREVADLKQMLIDFIIKFYSMRNKYPEQFKKIDLNLGEKNEDELHAKLCQLSQEELKLKLKQLWDGAGALLSVVERLFMGRILQEAKEGVIKAAFLKENRDGLLKTVGMKLSAQLKDFQSHNDFEKIYQIANDAQNLADLFRQLLKNPFIKMQEDKWDAFFGELNLSTIDYETLYGMLIFFRSMPQCNYFSLVKLLFLDDALIRNKERVQELLELLTLLNQHSFPLDYLNAISKWGIQNPSINLYPLIQVLIPLFEKDNKDPILASIMASNLSLINIEILLQLSADVSNRDALNSFLFQGIAAEALGDILTKLNSIVPNKSNKILDILIKTHAMSRVHFTKKTAENTTLIDRLIDLSDESLDLLQQFSQTTPVSVSCLLNALEKASPTADFSSFLLEFEKAPFGKRDLDKQFSITELERVVNNAKDLLADDIHAYSYRKNMMEAFLFVNAIGRDLPIYCNKPVKDLSNLEIKTFYMGLKAKTPDHLSAFQFRLIALALAREAVYRCTGEFPYSTQMLALIDCMLHRGDVITNIDTGQGKSLIDSMKAALLWLDSDRVDVTTSSLQDAMRDVKNYGSFYERLSIPYSEVITADSPLSIFLEKGVNFSTIAALSLFSLKAKIAGEKLDLPEHIVSWVVNESDYAILDDLVIYRFAIANGSEIGPENDWIYYAINEFVALEGYIDNNRQTLNEEISNLKTYLSIKAKTLNKSPKILDKFSNQQYFNWIIAALVANYVLKENEEYILPGTLKKKIIKEKEVSYRSAKVLMKDGRAHEESLFGRGTQQFLHAKLNTRLNCKDFLIDTPNTDVFSANNKNRIDFYQSQKGFIWGSSATVGSRAEIQEQYRKFGFEFSKLEAHQPKNVKINPPIFKDNEEEQFKELLQQLSKESVQQSGIPHLLFCKDIETAKRLFKLVQEKIPNAPSQIYTGLDSDEEAILHQASLPNMITVTTSIIGRNTNILYDRQKGLHVIHTCVGSLRQTEQKSGRTGRQGSPGEVSFIFNKKELANKEIHEIQAYIDQQGARERNRSEKLFDIIGYLLARVDEIDEKSFPQGKAAFYQQDWSVFSKKTEDLFNGFLSKQIKSQDDNACLRSQDLKIFIQTTLASYNTMMSKIDPEFEVREEDLSLVLEKKFILKPSKKTAFRAVKLEDCRPPIAIAYSLWQDLAPLNEINPGQREAIQGHLQHLHMKINTPQFVSECGNYLRTLTEMSCNRQVASEAHKDFFTRQLRSYLQKPSFLSRWFGLKSKLYTNIKNKDNLILWHAFAQISKRPVVDLDLIKELAKTFLDEYVETSWFVNSDRKKWVSRLKNEITTASDLETCIRSIARFQAYIAHEDIKVNEKRLIPLHRLGKSRLQTTLCHLENLGRALSGQINKDRNDLSSEHLSNLIEPDNQETPQFCPKREKTPIADRFNRQVLTRSIKKHAKAEPIFFSPSGMEGLTLFAKLTKEPASTIETLDRTSSTAVFSKK